MTRTVTYRSIAVLTLAALFSSCATTRLAPISSVGEAFRPENDERALWERSREEEKKLLEEIEVYNDPLLRNYLERVVGTLNPPAMAENPEIGYRITVLKEPTLNAFAYPHGSIYIHTGLLARMENEAQLATVLAHEMTHVENRHLVRYQRSARNKQIGLTAAAIVGAVVLASEVGDEYRKGHYGKAARIGVLSDLLLGLGLQLAFVASVNGYGRDLEQEADLGGFEKMRRAGYDVGEAEKVYAALLDDHGEPSKLEGFFFGSHPKLTNRIENAKSWNAEHGTVAAQDKRPDRDEFEKRIRPVIRDDAGMNIEIGRLKLAEDQLLRVVEMMPEDPETHYLLGRLTVRKMEDEKDEAEAARLLLDAMTAFREAIRLDPDLDGPHLELGLLAYQTSDYATACIQFRQYLDSNTDPDEAVRIRDYVRELELDGRCVD